MTAVRLAVMFSVGVSGVMGFFGYELGYGVYSSGEAGNYIRSLAPLVPLMFLDTTVDCILKGLGEQVYTMKVNIIDAAICLISVLLLVPEMGIAGYIVVIYISEAVNAALSIYRMQKITGLEIGAGVMLIPFLFVAASYSAVNIIDNIMLYGMGVCVGVGMRIVIFGVIYALICLIWECNLGDKKEISKKCKKI